jgi:hypothetical protein
MREIKFRAWDKKSETIISWDMLTHMIEGREIMAAQKANAVTPSKPYDPAEVTTAYRYRGNPFAQPNYQFELMQYTGLHDSEGSEIWESDLLRDQDGLIWKIKWSDFPGRWSWNDLGRTNPDKETTSYEPAPITFCKVIGNIYENPELIKEPTA